MTYRDICQLLCCRYDEGEARAVARYLLEVGYGLSMSDILSGAVEQLPQAELKENVQRLVDGEPVQYVVGTAEFCGRRFHVAPGVLIPRPETAELCQWIIEETRGGLPILDIGTGSGCIAITLALDIPNAEVEAWDISLEALTIAHKNANTLNANVTFKEKDIIKCSIAPVLAEQKVSVIVSNPPYIVPSESAAMSETVLKHEPDIALFTPEDDPLKFYRAISDYAKTALLPQGKLYFEINPLFAQQLEALLKKQGFGDITFKNDQYGKQRFVRATLNK
ncbi:MAG: peptide chain release factor N(5)-glutamine methyltransferase [Prevotellaceae bacterium]|nr:peptide chain release factor N(5)-glutamine methyltransferase [Prevotellaceae bacterium]